MRSVGALLAVAAMSASVHSAAAQGFTTACRWASNGTSFDLSPLTLPVGGAYNVSDSRTPDRYLFNVCQDTSIPGGNVPGNPCGTNVSTAFQVQTAQDCYALSQPASAGWNFSFINPVNPAFGVALTYSGGRKDWCQVSRQLTLAFQCAPDATNVFDTENVIEDFDCQYNILLKTIWGCPRECVTGSSVCSSNGVCGYDTDAKKSRCFCNTNWEGSSCSDRTKESGALSLEAIFLIIVCIILAGTMGLVGFMVLKLRRFQVDPAAYGELQGRFNELGQFA